MKKEIPLEFPPVIKNEKHGIKKKLQVLSIVLNKRETRFAILIGFKLSQTEQECYFLQVFQRLNMDDWQFFKHIDLGKDHRYICSQFEFDNKDYAILYFVNENFIFQYNIETLNYNPIYEFRNCLNAQPIYAVFNLTQNMIMVASFYDVLLVDLKYEEEVDIDN